MRLRTDAFLMTYGYYSIQHATDKKMSVRVHILKGLGYIPGVGPIAQMILFKMVMQDKPANADEKSLKKHMLVAIGARAGLALVCPFILPLIDIIGSIWIGVLIARNK